MFAKPKHVVKCTNACREGENHRSLPQLLKELNKQAEGKHPSQVALGGAVSQPMHVVIHVSPGTPMALSIKCCKAADILSCLTWRQKSWLSNAHNRKNFFANQNRRLCVQKDGKGCSKTILKHSILNVCGTTSTMALTAIHEKMLVCTIPYCHKLQTTCIVTVPLPPV